MALYSLQTPPPLESPYLIMGLAGWGDAASAASDAADWLADGGQPIVSFDADSVFDYRSNRPIIRFSAGERRSLTWPRMDIVHIKPGGRDVLVMVGNEPDFAWNQISDDLAELSQHLGVERLITLGSVPTPIRHSIDTAAYCTASDPRVLLDDDEMLMDDIVVPASAGTVFRAAIEEVGVSTLGYWAQVPQYVGRPYHPAIRVLLERVAAQLDVAFDLESISADAEDQIEKLDAILERRADAREFVEGLELSVGTTAKFPSDLPTADELADEVTKYLRDAENDENPTT
ncbi:MAG: PAC2 family protein [Acidimicrobiia bacterium]